MKQSKLRDPSPESIKLSMARSSIPKPYYVDSIAFPPFFPTELDNYHYHLQTQAARD